eukprot:TRINITY_DN24716_c0_g1_i1.p1 TRINITY_DN24716_c0_g1~~TRINITY_DN24716_c0_g1_i1.p1  ORF type:complete len:768 (+),score=227.80 TRINITY_DN24716_c0_g1_i1:40-2304(+)
MQVTDRIQSPLSPVRVVPVPAMLPPLPDEVAVVMSPPPVPPPATLAETQTALQELRIQYHELQLSHNEVMDSQVAPLQLRLAEVAELLNQEMLSKRGLDILLTERDAEIKVLSDTLQRQKLMEYVSKKAKDERINELEKKVRFEDQTRQERQEQEERMREMKAEIEAKQQAEARKRAPYEDALRSMRQQREGSRGRGLGSSRGRDSRRGRRKMEALRKELIPGNEDSVTTDPQDPASAKLLSEQQKQSLADEASRKSILTDRDKLLNLVSDMSADGELHSGTQVMIDNKHSIDTELQPTAPAPTPPAGPTATDALEEANTKEELAEVYARLNKTIQQLADLQEDYDGLAHDTEVEKALLAKAVVQAEEEAKAAKEIIDEQQELQNNQIKESENQRDHLKEVEDNHHQEKGALQKIIQQLRTALTQAAADNQDLDRRNTALSNDVKGLTNKLAEEGKKRETDTQNTEDLRNQLQRAQAIISSLNTDNQQYIDRLGELESAQLKDNLSTNNKITNLKNEGESLLAELRQKEIKLGQTLERLAAAVSEKEAMEEEINMLTRNLNQERLVSDAERRRADENDIVASRLRAEAQRARSDVEKLRNELDRQSSMFPSIEDALQRHTKEVSLLQIENTKLSETLEKQTTQLTESLEEASTLSSQHMILTEKVSSLKSVNDSLQADLSAARQVQQQTEALLAEEERRSVTAEAELHRLELKFKEVSAKSDEIAMQAAAQRRNMSPIRNALGRNSSLQPVRNM